MSSWVIEQYYKQLYEIVKKKIFAKLTIGDIFYAENVKVISPYLGERYDERTYVKYWHKNVSKILKGKTEKELDEFINSNLEKGVLFPGIENIEGIKISEVSGVFYVAEGKNLITGWYLHDYGQSISSGGVPIGLVSGVIAFDGNKFDLYSVYSWGGVEAKHLMLAKKITSIVWREKDGSYGVKASIHERGKEAIKGKENFEKAFAKLLVLQRIHAGKTIEFIRKKEEEEKKKKEGIEKKEIEEEIKKEVKEIGGKKPTMMKPPELFEELKKIEIKEYDFDVTVKHRKIFSFNKLIDDKEMEESETESWDILRENLIYFDLLLKVL